MNIEFLAKRVNMYNELYDEVRTLEGKEREEGWRMLQEQANELEALLEAMLGTCLISLEDYYLYLVRTTRQPALI